MFLINKQLFVERDKEKSYKVRRDGIYFLPNNSMSRKCKLIPIGTSEHRVRFVSFR